VKQGPVRRINVALQGGGAHGAFTWGVLDRLLEDETIEIAGISGTSAGGLNGAALKAGLVMGGRQAARDNLDWLWAEVAALSDFGLKRWMFGFWPMPSEVARFWADITPYPLAGALARSFSPYEVPFLAENLLRDIAEKFRFTHVCAGEGPFLAVSATNVRTGKIRVFTGDEITADVLLASACLPTLFRAVELHDRKTGQREAFWDGGYTGNPALFPLYAPMLPNDIVVVNINPLVRRELPRTAEQIDDRINEISFNAALLGELRSINFVRELIADGRMEAGKMKDVYVHLIADDRLMNDLTAETKASASPALIARLKEAGRKAAARFLTKHGEMLNVTGSVDLKALFG
jgi:NTE family protein